MIDNYLYRFCQKVSKSPNHPIEFDYSLLPNDNYIYHSLAYHLYFADRQHLFAPIFLNLRFAANKISQVGPSDLLNDYIDFQRFFFAENEIKLDDYRSFVASNSSVLCEPNLDILQIALCESDESQVYQDAYQLVTSLDSDLNRSYFNWTNKHNCSMEAPPKLLNFKCHHEVNCATYSPDSRYIVTISEKTLQVWNGITGEKITQIDDSHHEQINHCVFSRNGHYLLTSGDDGQAILWQNLLYLQFHPEESTENINMRNNRSFSTTSFDYMVNNEAIQKRHNCFNTKNLNSSNITESDVLYIQQVHQQRRRRSSGNVGYSTSSFNKHQPSLSRFTTFDLKSLKLKEDAIAESQSWSDIDSYEIPLSKTIKCGDISPDNKLVITGNGTGNLHLWSVNDAQQITSPLVMIHEDNHDETLYESGKIVDCCSFSGDSRFVLGLVSNIVYIYSIADNSVRSQQDLHSISSSPKSTTHYKFYTPPHSPRSPRRNCFQINLVRKLIHPFKVYNAVFHSISSIYYPFVFTSSGMFLNNLW